MTLVCPYLVDTGMFKGCRIRLASAHTGQCNCICECFFKTLPRTWDDVLTSNFQRIKLPRKHLFGLQSSSWRFDIIKSLMPPVSALHKTKRVTFPGESLPDRCTWANPPPLLCCCNSPHFVWWLQSAGGIFSGFTVPPLTTFLTSVTAFMDRSKAVAILFNQI